VPFIVPRIGQIGHLHFGACQEQSRNLFQEDRVVQAVGISTQRPTNVTYEGKKAQGILCAFIFIEVICVPVGRALLATA
jgi:hypothetical protein